MAKREPKPRCKTSSEVLPHINPKRPIFVYRNLHAKCLSVQQDGIVRCHVENIVLEDCEFRVGKAGQAKVRETKSKNVHAKVKGHIVPNPHDILDMGWTSVYYNPYKTDEFTDMENGCHVKSAKFVDIDTNDGVLGYGLEYFSSDPLTS
jgi:hypothetical protein